MTTINTSNSLGAKLLHYLPLNGTEGDIVTGQGYTLDPNAQFVDDPSYGKVLLGDGVNPALWMGTLDMTSVTDITIAFRAYISADNDDGTMFEIGQPWENAWGGIRFVCQAGGGDMYLNVNNNEGGSSWTSYYRPEVGWHTFILSIAGLRNGDYQRLTIDGALWARKDGDGGYTQGNRGNNPLRLLYRTDTPIAADEGPMAEFMIFSGVLTDEERTSLHNDWNQVINADTGSTAPDAPQFSSAIADNLNGGAMYIDFVGAILDWDTDPSKKIDPSQFVAYGSQTGNHTFPSMAWDASIGKIRIYGSSLFAVGEAVTVNYTDAGANTGIYEPTGQTKVASFGPVNATNNSQDPGDTTAPTLTTATLRHNVGDYTGQYVELQFNESINISNWPSAAAFAVTVNGVAQTVTAVSGTFADNGLVKVHFSEDLDNTTTNIAVSYTSPGGDTALRDMAGNLVASFANVAVSNALEAPGGSEPSASPYAYRFHRLAVLKTNGSYNDQWSCQELEFRAVPGGADLTNPSTPVTASSNNSQYGEVAANALNNDVTAGTSAYASDYTVAAPHTFTVDLGTEQEVQQLAFYPQVSTDTTMVQQRLPKDFDYLVSDNAAGPFILLHSVRGKTDWNLTGVNLIDVTAVPATAITLSGPASGGVGTSQPFTLQANGALPADITVTVNTPGLTPASQDLVIPRATGFVSFTLNPTAAGQTTLSFTSVSDLAMPANATYTAVTNLLRTWGSAGDDFATLDDAIDWANTQDPNASRMDVILEGSVMNASCNKSLGNANGSGDYRFIIRPRADLRHNYNGATMALHPSNAGATLTLGNGSSLGLARATVIEDYKLDLQSGGAIWNNRDFQELEPEFRRCIIRIGATDAISVLAWQKMIARDCLVYTDVAISRMINTAWDFSAYGTTFVVLPGGSCDTVMNQSWGGSNFRDCAFDGFNQVPVVGNVDNCFSGTMYGSMNGLRAVVASEMFVDINSNLRAGSALKGIASQYSVSTIDVLGNNRGLQPDVGAAAQVAATPLVVSEITSQPPVNGATVELSGTYSGTVNSATASLPADATNADGASLQGPQAITWSNGVWSVKFENVPSGNYARPQVIFTNDGGSRAATGGGAFQVIGFNGVTLDPGTSTAATAVVRVASPVTATVGVQATGFRYMLDGDRTDPVRVTPNDNGAGGTFAPLYADIRGGDVAEFSYTPKAAGQVVIAVTNDSALNNPPYINLTVQSAVLPAPTIGIATSDISVMQAARATLSGPVDTKGDPNAKVEVFADSQTSTASVLLGSTADGKVNVASGTWTGQFQNVAAGLVKFRAKVTANSQFAQASTGAIRVLDVSGSPRFPLP